jgi:hypothetical protein
MVQKSLVQSGDFTGTDQANSQIKSLLFQQALEKSSNDSPQETKVYSTVGLTIENGERLQWSRDGIFKPPSQSASFPDRERP